MQVQNVDEVYELAVKNGAVSLEEPHDEEYGYSAGFLDNFGSQCWIVKPE